mmetsp:Transcript_55798/g.153466  ORF Transcript_55798/g.153466 Transcript_55798/m.153466 type:complete len:178 (-) Transcript_55798:101-634(-)
MQGELDRIEAVYWAILRRLQQEVGVAERSKSAALFEVPQLLEACISLMKENAEAVRTRLEAQLDGERSARREAEAEYLSELASREETIAKLKAHLASKEAAQAQALVVGAGGVSGEARKVLYWDSLKVQGRRGTISWRGSDDGDARASASVRGSSGAPPERRSTAGSPPGGKKGSKA